ncbi:caspase family protein [Actinomadura rayongensis]|uniref:Peptidase C14 n=1 Tax=Actinomadura rayongensis TaxID=1429076 RepID=A0A6I4WA27_9ACTN|nr:caspase family protein [Actinomadura rayongensis]MXQ66023.1 hypothetical protein [Actinomadura rayongensis]
MAGRHALLLGVPECDDGRFSPIGDVVRRDISAMHHALDQSGYTVTTFGVDGPEPTRNRIARAIQQALADAPPDSVLLLYFSGHGVSMDGSDFLVPSDADGTDADDLVPVIPPDLGACPARLVVFFVDACRDDPARGDVPEPGAVVTFRAGGSFVLVNGCGPGQRCHYTESGSVFTQVLAQVLDRRHPARTLGGVVDEVTQEMRRRTRHTDLRQEPGVPHPAMLADARDVPICDGDELTGAWQRAAEETALWGSCAAPLRTAVLDLVADCARRCGAAYKALRARIGIEDPWFDQNYPSRVLARTAELLARPDDLTSAEAALLVAVPFLREVVLAEGIRLAAGIKPADFTRTYREGPRTDLEITHEMYQQMVRRAEGLGRRGETAKRDALAMWLVHEWLSTRLSVWQSPAAAECYRRGALLLDGDARGLSAAEVPKLVEALVRAVGARPADRLVLDRLNAAYLDDRRRSLAAVLWLGGILAADLRRMPPVIADHIGTRMELALPTVRNAADRLAWEGRGDACELRMPCDHPAQYAAFEDLVLRADRARASIAELPLDTGLVSLPSRFTADGLRAERRPDDTDAFDVPLSRFRLSEDKVRELLMGRQLYDDPALSIRELYQNALDACRYRDTRLKGLRSSGRNPAAWTGRIIFRQGTDTDGREYIECEDNGVGMDTDTLKHVFANAGERFVYRESFRAEQAAWADLTPPLRLVSNSQFGVGVFSYFMLADEITVETRPVNTNGIVSDRAYRVDIASSGSLFQITASDEMHGGGTRVRLYLTGDERVSAAATLRKLLWISDYRVEVHGERPTPEIWKPCELRYPDDSTEPVRFGDDLWWVSGEGGFAADGIRTEKKFFGLIVNLRDARRPQFTVDRKTLRMWDKKWVNEQIAASLPDLMAWSGLTLNWLWQVTESAPEIAQQVFDHLVERRHALPIGSSWAQDAEALLNEIGCLPDDRKLFEQDRYLGYGHWFTTWRTGIWSRLVSFRLRTRDRPSTVATEGFPVIEPGDAEIIAKLEHSGDRRLTADEFLAATIHADRPLATGLRRLRRYAITGLDVSALRHCPPLDLTIEKEEERPLARAFAAWAPPGSPPAVGNARCIIYASAELGLPLGQVVARVGDLMPDGWTSPDLGSAGLADYTCTNADVKLVSADMDGVRPWFDGPLEPFQLVAASGALGREVNEVLALCDMFAPLGMTVAGRDRYPDDLTIMEIETLRYVRTVGRPLTPLNLVMVAAKIGDTLFGLHDGLARLEEQGLIRRPDIAGLPDRRAEPEEFDFLYNPTTEFADYSVLRVFRSKKPCMVILKHMGPRETSQRNIALTQRLAPLARPDGPVSYPELVEAAGELRCSVAEARAQLLETYPDADVPPAHRTAETLYPTFDLDQIVLGRWMDESGPREWRIEPATIIRGAEQFGYSLGHFLTILAPYGELGAILPDVWPKTKNEFNRFYPDVYDADIVQDFDEHGREAPVSRFDALRLVRIAGRLGMPPTEVHRRLSRMAPIGLELVYPQDAVPDEIVRWQDVLLLTEYLDGQEPAVSGQVSAEHVAWAATETEESEEWIVGRLGVYAALFGLELEHLRV